MRKTRLGAYLLAFCLLLVWTACSSEPSSTSKPAGTSEQSNSSKPAGTSEPAKIRPAEEFNATAYRGKVLVLEIGQIVGCDNSLKGLAALENLRRANLPDLALAFVQASPNEEALKDYIAKGSFGFDVFSDPQGRVAGQYLYQAIPTFYLIGKEGDVRYRGPWDDKKWPEMIAAVRSEKPGDKKNVYLEEKAASGGKAPAFSLASGGANPVSLDGSIKDAKLLLLLFANDQCLYSKDALGKLTDLAKTHASNGLNLLVVHVGTWNPDTAAFYENLKVPCAVGRDEDRKLADAYGITAIPTALLIEPDGTIFSKALYSPETSRIAEVYLKEGPKAASLQPAQPGAGKG